MKKITEQPMFASAAMMMPKSVNITQILVILLIIAAFFLGSLYTKVQYLEKNGAPAQLAAGNQATGAQQQGTAPAPGQKVDVALGHFPIKGNKDAKVTIVEFEDFRCPFCQRYTLDTEPQIAKDYIDTGKVQLAFRQYPFLGPASNVAADAAECANDQNKFWEFHDYMFKNQPSESDTSMYNTDSLTKIATSLGMNGNDFRSCLDAKKDDAKAQADFQDGQKAGVSGTPTFYVNGLQLVGAQPYSAFKTAIDAELNKKS